MVGQVSLGQQIIKDDAGLGVAAPLAGWIAAPASAAETAASTRSKVGLDMGRSHGLAASSPMACSPVGDQGPTRTLPFPATAPLAAPIQNSAQIPKPMNFSTSSIMVPVSLLPSGVTPWSITMDPAISANAR
jgi:hypothetical protein